MTWSAEARLVERNITLPAAAAPQATYTNCVQVGSLLFVAGKGPRDPGSAGKLGRELSTAQGAQVARGVGLEVLAAVRAHLGSLDLVRRVVRVQAFVNATEDYTEHHLAVDGLSELFVEVLGDAGIHTRSVLGAVSLRGGLPVVAECVFEVADERAAVTARAVPARDAHHEDVDAAAPGAGVLVIGLDPYRVPGPWDPEPVARAVAQGMTRFDEAGVTAVRCLVPLDGSEDVEQVVTDALRSSPWQVVLVGGGIRKQEDLLGLFERVVNLVHRHAPQAAIAFNTTPDDVYDAAARWLD